MDAGPGDCGEVRWLTSDDVEDRSSTISEVEEDDEVAAMLGGGQSVGGVVNDTVGNTCRVINITERLFLKAVLIF